MSSSGQFPDWLSREESKYAEDFVEEEGSFLILPNREVANDVQNSIAIGGDTDAINASSVTVKSHFGTPNTSLQNGGTNVSNGNQQSEQSPPTPSPRSSLTKPEASVESKQGPSDTLSFISVVSPGSSVENSLDETNMLLNQLDLQSCKQKMIEMTENAVKNLEAYKDLQSTLVSLRGEHQKKYDECGETIRTLRAENQSLTGQLEKLKLDLESKEETLTGKDAHIKTLEEQLSRMKADLTDTQTLLNEQILKLQETTLDNTALNSHLQQLKLELRGRAGVDELSSLQEERNVLNDAWEASKITVVQLKEDRAKKEEMVEKLSKELEETKGLVERMKDYKVKREEDVSKLKSALDQAGNTLRQFQTIVAEKEGEVQNLQTRMAALSSENEQTDIWQQQMTQYQSDFEGERRDRESMAAKLEETTQQLTAVQTQLEQKTAELENLHKIHIELVGEHLNRAPPESRAGGDRVDNPTNDSFVMINQNNGASAAANNHLQQTSSREATPPIVLGPQTPPPCPLCNKKFSSVASLQRHASGCGIEAQRADPFAFV